MSTETHSNNQLLTSKIMNAYISNFSGQDINQMINSGQKHLHLTASLIETPNDAFDAGLGYTQRARYADQGEEMTDTELWEQFFDCVGTDLTRWIEDNHNMTVCNVFGEDPTGYENDADIVITYEKA